MTYSIIKIRSSKELRAFIDLPLKLYEDYPRYVFPLISYQKKLHHRKKNPFFKHAIAEYFLLLKSGRPVGRIVAIINNNHLKRYNDKRGFFGFFECINDNQASEILIDHARFWLKEKGMSKMLGPENFSTNESVGILTNGYELNPSIMMPYNPEYYQDLFEQYGLKESLYLDAFHLTVNDELEKLAKKGDRIKNYLLSKGITIRPITVRNFGPEKYKLMDVYNQAFDDNWGFIPLEKEEFSDYADLLRTITPPDLMIVAEENNRFVGFICSVPDYNQVFSRIRNGKLWPMGISKYLLNKGRIDRTRILILGVLKEFRNKGIDLALYTETFKSSLKRNIRTAEAAYVMENNSSMRIILKKLGACPVKRYKLYEINC